MSFFRRGLAVAFFFGEAKRPHAHTEEQSERLETPQMIKWSALGPLA
jgi:hypothetical protein